MNAQTAGLIEATRAELRAKAAAVAATAPPLTDQQRETLRPMLARRHAAALRLPPLADGRRDPLVRRSA